MCVEWVIKRYKESQEDMEEGLLNGQKITKKSLFKRICKLDVLRTIWIVFQCIMCVIQTIQIYIKVYDKSFKSSWQRYQALVYLFCHSSIMSTGIQIAVQYMDQYR
eukprot:UN00200